MALRFNILGMGNVALWARHLSSYSGDIRSVRPVVERAVEEVIIPRIKLNFANQSDSDVYSWESLGDVTPFFPYRRVSGNQFGPTLSVTGNLERVATQKNIWNFEGSGQHGEAFANISNTSAFYGFYQQEGFVSHLTGTRVPARPFISIGPNEIERIAELFDEFARENMGLTIGTKTNRIRVEA